MSKIYPGKTKKTNKQKDKNRRNFFRNMFIVRDEENFMRTAKNT